MATAGAEPLIAICMPQGHGTAMERARRAPAHRTVGGHGIPGKALESGHAWPEKMQMYGRKHVKASEGSQTPRVQLRQRLAWLALPRPPQGPI